LAAEKNGLAYQSLVNEISAEEMSRRAISQNSSLAPRDAPQDSTGKEVSKIWYKFKQI
jgi:hypothetical protein